MNQSFSRVIPGAPVVPIGLDLAAPAGYAKPGTLRLAYNYEPEIGGGMRRLDGIERFDGRPRPSDASYVALVCAATPTANVGDVINGLTSGATGEVIYKSGTLLAVTRVTGNFQVETIRVGVTSVGSVTSTDSSIDGFLDNQLLALAANDYRADITVVPGSGRIRGLAVLNDTVYAWRNNAGGTAMAIYKSSGTGWTLVPLLYELSFVGGSTEPAEGATIAQGGTSAVIKRVVLESGTWLGGTAAGRYIITAPTGGSFSAGVFTTASMGSVPAAGSGVYQGTQITLAPDGVVRTDTYNFTARVTNTRLYGCDGVNREFEFDGTVLVPLKTGMGSVRATVVQCHKNHLFFGYEGSLQCSGVGTPYIWSPIFGAAELGTGDKLTDLVSIGGSEDAAAMMVLCANSVLVLYGTSSADFKLVPLSSVSGCSPGSAQDVDGVVALDSQGFVRYRPTQSYGNFAWSDASLQISAIARGQEAACSVFVAHLNKYRCFFADGTSVTGMLTSKGFDWTTVYLGRTVRCAAYAEIAGNARTFYGADDGYVYEADVGRSLDGDVIQYAIKTNELNQNSPMVLKQFRGFEVEAKAGSAFTLRATAEFADADNPIAPSEQLTLPQYGSGLFFDLSNLDESYWDVPAVARKRFQIDGQGTTVSLILAGESDNELAHVIQVITPIYTPRRIAR